MARHKKAINIQLVAQQAGVSVATVSRVINHHTDVSEEVRRRIQDVMTATNFTPTRGSERVANIGVVVFSDAPILGEYPAQVINGMTAYSSENNVEMSIILDCCRNGACSLLRSIRARRCDAVALLMCERQEARLAELEQAELPTMLVNHPKSGAKRGFVNNESYAGARQAMEYLISLGHRKIGVVEAEMESSDNHHQRLNAYFDAMRACGAETDARYIAAHIPTRLGQEAGYRQALQLFATAPELTAVFALNDEMAMGVLKACWDTGRRVPEDVSVIGFDDLPVAEFFHPALTTVHQPLMQLGYLAIKHLDEFLKGDSDELPGITLGTELVIRHSAAAPKKEI